MTRVTGLWPTVLRNRTNAPVFSPTPRDVSVEITARCQLRCTHCFNHSGPDNHQELSFETIERILDEVAGWDVHKIRISGGEPTLHRRFEEVVRACRQRDLSISMNTNGIYSTTRLDYLRTAQIDLFMVSLDGLAEHNDAIRGAGTFDRVLRSCRVLRKAGQRVMLCCHVTRATVDDIPGLVELAEGLGCDLKISPVRPIGRAREEMAGLILEPEAYLRVVDTIVRHRRAVRKTKVFTDFDILEESGDGDCARDPGRASCKAGRTMVNINYDGKIYPCAFFTTPAGEFAAGSVHDDTIENAWTSAAFEPFRVHTKSDECQSCGHYQNKCAGGCPAVSHFTYGVLDALDPMCFARLVGKGEPDGDK